MQQIVPLTSILWITALGRAFSEQIFPSANATEVTVEYPCFATRIH